MVYFENTLLVSNLKPVVTEEDVHKMFVACGEVSCIVSPADGSYYVIFKEKDSVNQAITSLQSAILHGRQVNLKPVTHERELQLASLLALLENAPPTSPDIDREVLGAVGGKGIDVKATDVVVTQPKPTSTSTQPNLITSQLDQTKTNVVDSNLPKMSLFQSNSTTTNVTKTGETVTTSTTSVTSDILTNLLSGQSVPSVLPTSGQSSTIHVQQQYMLPKLSFFSGEPSKNANEVSFRQWCYEVKGLVEEGFSDGRIIASMWRNLRGKAAEALMNLGSTTTVAKVLEKFELLFGEVQQPEVLLQCYFDSEQQVDESVSAWSCRLETTLSKLKIWQSEARQMLRSKFWNGLQNTRIKDALRHHYEFGMDYDQLVAEARKREKEFAREIPETSSSNVKKSGAKTMSAHASGQPSENVSGQMSQLLDQMKKFQVRLDKMDKPQFHKKLFNKNQYHKDEKKTESKAKDKAKTEGFIKKRKCFKCGSENHLIKQCPNK